MEGRNAHSQAQLIKIVNDMLEINVLVYIYYR